MRIALFRGGHISRTFVRASTIISHMKSGLKLSLILLLFLGVNRVHASAHEPLSMDTLKSIFQMLSHEEVLKMSITTDINEFLHNKNTDESQKATLLLEGQDHLPAMWQVKISARGKHRRRTCDFPPVRIKFKKSELKANGLSPFKSYKLVTHCSDRAIDEELILKEYLTYKMYNIITPASFNVQLVKIKWTDTSGSHDIGEQWGFIIEQKDEILERLNCTPHDEFGAMHHQLDTECAGITYMFQYMIGNHDWNVESSRNMFFVHHESFDEIIPIPYDFDFSILVGAYYLSLNWELEGSNKRKYLGDLTDAENKSVVEIFKSKKKEIYGVINSFGYLSRDSRYKMIKYLRSFYKHLSKPLNRVSNDDG